MAMDEMKMQLFEQERWIRRLSALSGLVYMLSKYALLQEYPV